VKRSTAILLLLALLALGLGAWAGNGPRRGLWQIQQAVEKGDAAALAARTDLPALQASLRQALQARVDSLAKAHEAQAPGKNKEALADVLASASIEPLAQGLSQPEGLRWLLYSAQAPDEAWSHLQEQRRGLTTSAVVTGPSVWSLSRREGPVWWADVQGDTRNPAIHLQLSRHGWADWKLSGIKF
jgi:hypothetical protein